MFYVVENEEQLSRLETISKCVYVDIITTNDNFHPALTGLVAVYVRPLWTAEKEKGYIIPVCHDEGLGVEKERVVELLSKFKEIYILNKKAGLYHFNLGKNVIDLALKYAMLKYEKLDIYTKVPTYHWYYNRYGDMENLNQIIPLPKLYEKCEEVFEQVRNIKFIHAQKQGTYENDLIEESLPSGFDFYNETATKVYFLVEQNGMRVDRHEFIEKYKPTNPDFSMIGETVYTSYNLYNATSRPTNSFNAVNFLALPKSKEYRRLFKPQPGGHFVELDYDGFHVRLVSEQIGYQLSPDEKAHRQLAKLYFKKEEVSEEEYGKAKGLNFQMIYGSIPEEYRNLEFSRKIREYTDKLWKDFQRTVKVGEIHQVVGEVHNPVSGKAFTQELPEMHPQKLMNYMVQSLETSKNVLTLCRILGFLARGGYNTKVILITYDSFLLDVAPGEDSIIPHIRYIMEGRTDNKLYETPIFPVGIKESKDLYF